MFQQKVHSHNFSQVWKEKESGTNNPVLYFQGKRESLTNFSSSTYIKQMSSIPMRGTTYAQQQYDPYGYYGYNQQSKPEKSHRRHKNRHPRSHKRRSSSYAKDTEEKKGAVRSVLHHVKSHRWGYTLGVIAASGATYYYLRKKESHEEEKEGKERDRYG